MLILLPPSETKARPRRGNPLRLETLSFPELTAVREHVIDALAATSAQPDALTLLGVPPTLGEEVAANTSLRSNPTRPALEVYTGVLYDALGMPSLSAAGRRRAARRLVVVSALYGAVRPGDRIAPYRLSMAVNLPGVGPLARAWRPALEPVLSAAAGSGLIIDCRSSTYAAAWTPPPALAPRWVVTTVPGATHMAKYTRGLLARALCETATDPRRPAALLPLLAAEFEVTLAEPAKPAVPWTLSIRQR